MINYGLKKLISAIPLNLLFDEINDTLCIEIQKIDNDNGIIALFNGDNEKPLYIEKFHKKEMANKLVQILTKSHD